MVYVCELQQDNKRDYVLKVMRRYSGEFVGEDCGYLFCSFSKSSNENALKFLSDVRNYVYYAGQLDDGVAARWLRSVREYDRHMTGLQAVRVGCSVQVKDGRMGGFIGEVVEVRGAMIALSIDGLPCVTDMQHVEVVDA